MAAFKTPINTGKGKQSNTPKPETQNIINSRTAQKPRATRTKRRRRRRRKIKS